MQVTADFLRQRRAALDEERTKAVAVAQRAAGAIVFIDNLIAYLENPGDEPNTETRNNQ